MYSYLLKCDAKVAQIWELYVLWLIMYCVQQVSYGF